MDANKIVVFDLDDTLLFEVDFLESAYREIAQIVDAENAELAQELFVKYQKGQNVFEYIIDNYRGYTLDILLKIYREHVPSINLRAGALELLQACIARGYTLGLVTDGRSLTQRNKLRATGIESFFDRIIVSEEIGSTKPAIENYMPFEESKGQKFYIADNPKKDFLTPKSWGWKTICILDNGKHIHTQNFDLEQHFLPDYKVSHLKEVLNLLQK